jgi:hypothetical protein
MQLFALLVLLAAAPLTAQEPAEKASDEAVATLPSRQLPPVLMGTPIFPPSSKPYSDNFELTLAMGRTTITDPLGRCGKETFQTDGPDAMLRLDRKRLYLDAEGSFPKWDFRQSRLESTGRWLFAHPGQFSIGVELNYRRFVFSRLVATVSELRLMTERSGQVTTFGAVTRYQAPRHTTFWASLAVGEYRNRYDSTVTLGPESVSEPVVNEHPSMGQARLAVKTAPIFGRIRLSGLVRYSWLWHPGSSWTPRDELSGEMAIDLRAVSSKHLSLYLGARARLSPQKPSLTSDGSVDAHASLLIR